MSITGSVFVRADLCFRLDSNIHLNISMFKIPIVRFSTYYVYVNFAHNVHFLYELEYLDDLLHL